MDCLQSQLQLCSPTCIGHQVPKTQRVAGVGAASTKLAVPGRLSGCKPSMGNQLQLTGSGGTLQQKFCGYLS